MSKFTSKRARRSFTPEFKAEAVKLATSSEKSIGQVAKDLDLTETALRNWVRQARHAQAVPSGEVVTADERAELMRLREENRELRMQRDFLKKATAFFAKESN
jgi:transposase